jgi:hypothetical protein
LPNNSYRALANTLTFLLFTWLIAIAKVFGLIVPV